MSTIDGEDRFIVQRGLTTYQLPASDMSTIQDDDLLLVARGSDHYKVSGADVLAQLGGGDDGVWVDDIRLRDGANGLPWESFYLADSLGQAVTPETSWDQYCRTLSNWSTTPDAAKRQGVSIGPLSPNADNFVVLVDLRNCAGKKLRMVSYTRWSSAKLRQRNVYMYANALSSSVVGLRTNLQGVVGTSSSETTVYKIPFTAEFLLGEDSYDALPVCFRAAGWEDPYIDCHHLCLTHWFLEEPSREARQERRQERRAQLRAPLPPVEADEPEPPRASPTSI